MRTSDERAWLVCVACGARIERLVETPEPSGGSARNGFASIFYNVSTGAVAALLTVALEALNGLPLQRERVEAVPEIGRQSCRVVAQLFHVLDRCAQLPPELLYLLLSTPVHVQEARR